MKNTRIIALIGSVVLWGIGTFLLYKEGKNNITIIFTAVIIIVAFTSKLKKNE
jgi:hypothetical protein